MDGYYGFVAVEVGLATVVLPVMGVDALGGIVFGEVERTELSFVVEHVEIIIFRVVVNQRG
jgi:hypothetical protein